MKITPSSAIGTITLGAWTLLIAHLIGEFLKHDAYVAVLTASVVGSGLYAGERIVSALRELGDRLSNNTLREVIAAMAGGKTRALIELAELQAQAQPWPDSKPWSDTGPFPAVHGLGRN